MGGRGKRKYTCTCYSPEMVGAFENLVKDLEPDDDYLREGRIISSEIFKALEAKAHKFDFRVARRRIAGSVGKDTCISYEDPETEKVINSDFDIIILVNEVSPPFDDLLEDMKEILAKSKLQIKERDVKVTSISLQFSYYSEELDMDIEFDLLPAPNYVYELEDDEDLAEEQALEALEVLKEEMKKEGGVSSKLNRLFSSSFTERSYDIIMDYIKRDDFYRKVIMLGKYWMAQLEIPMYVRAKSFMVELVAIYSQRRRRRKCIISGFRRFLESMEDFNELFVQIGGSHTAHENDPYWKMVMRGKGAKIIHPANPYDNLAEGINPNAVKIIRRQAKETLKLLDENRSMDEREAEDFMEEIFSHK